MSFNLIPKNMSDKDSPWEDPLLPTKQEPYNLEGWRRNKTFARYRFLKLPMY